MDELTEDDVVSRLLDASGWDWEGGFRRYFVEAPEVDFIIELDHDWDLLDLAEREVEGEWETMRREESEP